MSQNCKMVYYYQGYRNMNESKLTYFTTYTDAISNTVQRNMSFI